MSTRADMASYLLSKFYKRPHWETNANGPLYRVKEPYIKMMLVAGKRGHG